MCEANGAAVFAVAAPPRHQFHYCSSLGIMHGQHDSDFSWFGGEKYISQNRIFGLFYGFVNIFMLQ